MNTTTIYQIKNRYSDNNTVNWIAEIGVSVMVGATSGLTIVIGMLMIQSGFWGWGLFYLVAGVVTLFYYILSPAL